MLVTVSLNRVCALTVRAKPLPVTYAPCYPGCDGPGLSVCLFSVTPGLRNVRDLTSLHPELYSGRHVVAEHTATHFPISLRSSPGYNSHMFHPRQQLSPLTGLAGVRRQTRILTDLRRREFSLGLI